jgi:hypothetical protein
MKLELLDVTESLCEAANNKSRCVVFLIANKSELKPGIQVIKLGQRDCVHHWGADKILTVKVAVGAVCHLKEIMRVEISNHLVNACTDSELEHYCITEVFLSGQSNF